MRKNSVLPSCRWIVVGSLLAALVAAWGCAEKTPAERVAEARAEYVVQLRTWLPQPPAVDETAEAEDEAAAAGEEAAAEEAVDEEVEETAAGEEEAELAPPEPMPTSILFDVILYFNGDKPLPGITVDITHADAQEQAKKVYKHWIETAEMVQGRPRALNFVLEIDDFVEGDVFSMEIRRPIPEAERGEYQEFATGD